MGSTNWTPEVRREMITKKAYELYVKRGKKPGHELDDWLQAEKLVDREQQEQSSGSKNEPIPSSRPVPTPIRNTSKVGYKRVQG